MMSHPVVLHWRASRLKPVHIEAMSCTFPATVSVFDYHAMIRATVKQDDLPVSTVKFV